MINRSGEIKQYYIVYANANMTGTRIVCPIYTVNLGDARSDLVAWLARLTLEPVDQGRFLGGHLLYIIFFFFFFQLYNNNNNLLYTSNMNMTKSTLHNALY